MGVEILDPTRLGVTPGGGGIVGSCQMSSFIEAIANEFLLVLALSACNWHRWAGLSRSGYVECPRAVSDV